MKAEWRPSSKCGLLRAPALVLAGALRLVGVLALAAVVPAPLLAATAGAAHEEQTAVPSFEDFIRIANEKRSSLALPSSEYNQMPLEQPEGFALVAEPKLASGQRYQQQALDHFEPVYRQYLRAVLARAPRSALDAKAASTFSLLIASRAEAVAQQYEFGQLRVVTVLDKLNRDVVQVTPQEGSDTTYLVGIGVDFLRRLDESILKSCFSVTSKYLGDHRSLINGINLSLPQVLSLSAFVDIAPQIDPRNHARAEVLLPGGAARSQAELVLGGIGTVGRLNSRIVPPDVKKMILSTPVLASQDFGADDDTSEPAVEDLLRYYLDPRSALKDIPEQYQFEVAPTLLTTPGYVAALHFYMLRDVLTYLIGHEMAHVVQVSKHSTFPDPISEEADADRQTLQRIVRSRDTDIRAIVLAMESFIAEYGHWGEGEIDPDHPIPAARLAVIQSVATQIEPSLLLDLQAGLEFLKQPIEIAQPQTAGVKEVQFSQSFDHSIKLYLAFDDQHSALYSEREKHGLGAQLTVGLYEATRPAVDAASASFEGNLELTGVNNELSSDGKESGKRAQMLLRVPPEMWTHCLNCETRIESMSLSDTDRGVGQWSVSTEAPAVLMQRIDEAGVSSDLVRYSYLYLARGFVGAARPADAAAVYSRMPESSRSVLTPSDYLQWAAETYKTDPKKALSIIDGARTRFPLNAGLGYAEGLLNEVLGQPLAALDGYFHEINGTSESHYAATANVRLLALLGGESPPIREYALGFYRYYLAQQVGEGRTENYRAASEHFRSVYETEHSQAAEVSLAETSMYEAVMEGRPASEARALFQKIVADRPYFIPGYVHLFQIDACEQHYREAILWLQKGLERVPVSNMEMLDSAVKAVDSGQLKTFCTKSRLQLP